MAAATFSAEARSDDIDSESVASFFDAALAVEQNVTPLAGVVVTVVRNNEVIFARGYGYADIDRRIPVDPDQTLFRLASVTKTFVWTGVMQQVEAGNIDLDADINEYLDFEVPHTYEQPVTMRNLMTHTAGFEDQWTGYSSRRIEDVPALGTFLAKNIPMRVRPPGELSSYSNYGTALAGYIVERVSGSPWSVYTDEHILRPLGMNNSSAQQPLPDDLEQRRAIGYSFWDGTLHPLPYWFDNIPPDGVMSATASDMGIYMRMHLGLGAFGDTRIMSEATARQMQSVLFQKDRDIYPFLHGFYRTDRNGIVSFGHSGDWNGFHSILTLFPDQNLGVFIAVNSDNAAKARARLMQSFMDRFFERPAIATTASIPPLSLSEYLGDWVFVRRNQSTFEKLSVLVGSVDISEADESQLRVVIDSESSRWIAYKPDRFREIYGERRLIFMRNADGLLTNAIFSSSPWNALEPLRGLDSPTLHWRLLYLAGSVALLSLICIPTVIIRRRSARTRLFLLASATSALLAVVILTLLLGLQFALTGNIEDFQFGAPPTFTRLLALAWLAVFLIVAVIGLTIRMLVTNSVSRTAKFGFALLGIVGVIFSWQLWYWNILQF